MLRNIINLDFYLKFEKSMSFKNLTKNFFLAISGINTINLNNQTYVDKKTLVRIENFKWKNTENVKKHKKSLSTNHSLLHEIYPARGFYFSKNFIFEIRYFVYVQNLLKLKRMNK